MIILSNNDINVNYLEDAPEQIHSVSTDTKWNTGCIKQIQASLPKELFDRNQWVLWKYESKSNGKVTKVLYNPRTGNKADSTNATTWSPFAESACAYKRDVYDGIGFVLTEYDPYVGIDIDHCITDGNIDEYAMELVRRVNSYTEITPSGNGLRIWARGKKPGKSCKKHEMGVEIYDNVRFFTVTGNHLEGTPSTIEDRQQELDAVYQELWPQVDVERQPICPVDRSSIPTDDRALIEVMLMARNGSSIQALYGGDISGYNNDHSSADQAFCNHLAFYTGNDPERMDRMFRQSGLMRPKWDRRARSGELYGQGTIARAIAATREMYKGRSQSSNGSEGNNMYTNGRVAPEMPGYMNDIPPAWEGVDSVDHVQDDADHGGEQSLPLFKFEPLSFDDLMAMPPKEWLVENIIGAGDIGMIYGQPGCGKTFVAIDMILSACLGRQWAGRFGVTKQLSVAYCAGEGARGLRDRFAAAASSYGVNTIPNFSTYTAVPQLFVERGDPVPETIFRFVQEWKMRQEAGKAGQLDLLIIDTLNTATVGAEENSAKDMGKALQACRHAVNELGCAIILVHHSNKAGTGERGSSALRGAMDFMIEISRPSDATTRAVMSCTKMKDGDRWGKQEFDLEKLANSVFVRWETIDEITSEEDTLANRVYKLVAESMPGGIVVKEIANETGQAENRIRAVLNNLAEKKKVVRRPMNPDKPMNARNPSVYFTYRESW